MAAYDERVATVVPDILDAVQERLEKHKVTHEEYRAAWRWLTGLAASGEVPLFLDVFFEAVVERLGTEGRPGSAGTVQGPYHVPDAVLLTGQPYILPMREDEPGEPMLFTGRVTDLDGAPLAGVLVDMWQAGNDGTYSGFVGDAPEGNLRARLHTGEDGTFTVRTIRPAPYRIPDSGPTGELLGMLGRHTWRPAHFHFILTADGREPLTTQLYFRGDPWLDEGDVVGAVKDSLVIDVREGTDREAAARAGLDGPHLAADYAFTLRPAEG
ncbi:dioxygenase [Streptomyces aidingensis]|uniref:Catechol 1,2-dioxygenase n=1 Tax=Streptomyces aidingensis TaxID=910347 RepID=A0A1I1H7P1_9ACTN|nr:dioxygenase [Streptomyces aidingensis]SFC19602.1 catechol 1,2-dioxygenase [Streptomyces aidingensis]